MKEEEEMEKTLTCLPRFLRNRSDGVSSRLATVTRLRAEACFFDWWTSIVRVDWPRSDVKKCSQVKGRLIIPGPRFERNSKTVLSDVASGLQMSMLSVLRTRDHAVSARKNRSNALLLAPMLSSRSMARLVTHKPAFQLMSLSWRA